MMCWNTTLLNDENEVDEGPSRIQSWSSVGCCMVVSLRIPLLYYAPVRLDGMASIYSVSWYSWVGNLSAARFSSWSGKGRAGLELWRKTDDEQLNGRRVFTLNGKGK